MIIVLQKQELEYSQRHLLNYRSITFTEVAYEFDIQGILNIDLAIEVQVVVLYNIRIWEFRGAINSTVYDANDDTTYTVLHTHNENTHVCGKYKSSSYFN